MLTQAPPRRTPGARSAATVTVDRAPVKIDRVHIEDTKPPGALR